VLAITCGDVSKSGVQGVGSLSKVSRAKFACGPLGNVLLGLEGCCEWTISFTAMRPTLLVSCNGCTGPGRYEFHRLLPKPQTRIGQ